MPTRTSADAPFVYNGAFLGNTAQHFIRGAAEREAEGKTAAELFAKAESEYYMATRHYPRTDGRERQADRAMLRAATFDRLARELDAEGFVEDPDPGFEKDYSDLEGPDE